MESLTQKVALKFTKANFVPEKVTNRYFHRGNLVKLKSPTTTTITTITTTPTRNTPVFPPIFVSERAAVPRAGEEPELKTTRIRDPVSSADMASKDPILKDDRLARISSSIRVIPDFPKPGIMFQDITTLLLDTKAFKDTIDLFVERYKDKNISVVAGIEARGFIFGPPIALAIGAKFVPMRKPKKLPGEVISEEYSLEYGTDKIEMHVGAVQAGERALVVDDLIATGGTLAAAIRLLERVGVEVVECACLIELPELKGRDRLGDKPLFVLVSST
ncbi:PREDICTED: adenine phosphoribosyltransferase 1-like [Nicotiana attenuata]|uniref:adenine phosphoribosyltransferase n=1 Tax=Nicotiana attenuata TaxID=49451 RepID=A0A1J6I005_NICAT|nr:PREDICTED: adenine phosphoribosyltransferase 1-like [Nicotiana attenuata]OIS98420.1 adenine phosphoribosyltransferase 1, chloroplastic [Nicotiana attenuata]